MSVTNQLSQARPLKVILLSTALFLFSYLLLNVSAIADTSSNEVSHADLMAAHKYTIGDRRLGMIGMGVTRLVNDDYYIGALYVDEQARFTNEEELMVMNVARSMKFRFVSDRKVSARGFGRKIAEAIRVNNSSKDIKAQKSMITKLLPLFKGSYKRGDEVRFDYHSDNSTRVFVNDEKLTQFRNSNKLFLLLLNTWIGKTPPSEKFKQGILGKNESEYDVELLKRFVSRK